jgi:hypothetical protein
MTTKLEESTNAVKNFAKAVSYVPSIQKNVQSINSGFCKIGKAEIAAYEKAKEMGE